MATSEFIRKTSANDQPVLGLPSRKGIRAGGVVGPSMVSSLIMMLNDSLAILLAFGTALVLARHSFWQGRSILRRIHTT